MTERTRFTVFHRSIQHHDDRPGSHATMFDPRGTRLAFAAAQSSFNDSQREYTWAFDLVLPPKAGQRFTFATVDREVTGLVGEGNAVSARELPLGTTVERDASGKPIRLKK